MQTGQLLACTLALLLVVLPSLQPGTATPSLMEPPAEFDLLCDMQTKTCDDAGVDPDLIAYPMTGSVLQTIRPFVSPELYALLNDIVGGDEKGPNPVPPPPGPLALPAGADPSVVVGLGGVDVAITAWTNASVAGFGVHRDVTASATLDLDDDEEPTEAPCEGPAGQCKKQGPQQVPCSDPRGCPDLVVDAAKLREGGIYTQTFQETSCSVQEGSVEAGQRRLLRFTFTSPNFGNGDLIVGDPDDNPQWFEWGDCHNHWHFREYADYRLWTPEAYLEWREAKDDDPDADPASFGDGFITGHKQGFCVIDITRYIPTQLSAKYHSCSSNQGISSGWADTYHYGLDGQWVDITGVEPGLYVLEADVNTEHLYLESDYSNNSGAIFVVIPPET